MVTDLFEIIYGSPFDEPDDSEFKLVKPKIKSPGKPLLKRRKINVNYLQSVKNKQLLSMYNVCRILSYSYLNEKLSFTIANAINKGEFVKPINVSILTAETFKYAKWRLSDIIKVIENLKHDNQV